ncbi:hypothetical protein BKA70DRAFT_1369915 [Coprinopsis sp. MPI-PUGE-AT-0042]|nr:hypothetical protein BKA70DRAFT_1369915 [Coprinopsis sp. MPI-PUGE-AT-0042]
MDPEQQTGLLAPTAENLAKVKVFPLIPALKKDITVNSALSWEQLTAADINFSIVRPLVNKYARLRNISVVYACLVVRQYFLSEAEAELAFAGVMQSRASLCELMAIKLLNRYATRYIQLVAVLTTSWSPLAGATDQVIEDIKQNMNASDEDLEAVHTLQMAIATEAKSFIASPITQKVVNDIYTGHVVFSVTANRSLVADNYKTKGIEIHDPRRTPWLDHYRLRVPRYGNYLEFINFALLLFTFMACLNTQDKTKITFWEVIFIVFASAFTLEEYTASTGHGWITVIWNAFDFTFIVIFLAYMGLRLRGLSTNNVDTAALAFDVLACGACILFPRLAFFFVSDNLVILSLRAMISQFAFFITIAAICFSGLLFTLWTLAADNPDGKNWTIASISWLMVQIWFGNTSLSFAQASSFHPLFGPILMTTFAAMSNTLLLTILISILSNTVARIDAVGLMILSNLCLLTCILECYEGISLPVYHLDYGRVSRSNPLVDLPLNSSPESSQTPLFSYQPPFNILAFVILKPLSWMLTPRYLHTANVFLIRFTSLPQLIVIGLYERHLASVQNKDGSSSADDGAATFYNSLPRHIKNMPLVEALVGSASNDLFDAIFDVEVEDDLDPFETDDELDDGPALRSYRSRETVRSQFSRARSERPNASRNASTRRSSPSPSANISSRRRKSRPGSIRVDLSEPSPVAEEPSESSALPPSSTRGNPPTQLYSPPPQSSGAYNFPRSPSASGASPRRPRMWSMLSPLDVVTSPEIAMHSTTRSPLARLYSNRLPSAGAHSLSPPPAPPNTAGAGLNTAATAASAVLQMQMQTDASVKRVEAILEDAKTLPVQKLKDEMKELQDRQARIENLLLMLTRGMRNETSSRQGSL